MKNKIEKGSNFEKLRKASYIILLIAGITLVLSLLTKKYTVDSRNEKMENVVNSYEKTLNATKLQHALSQVYFLNINTENKLRFKDDKLIIEDEKGSTKQFPISNYTFDPIKKEMSITILIDSKNKKITYLFNIDKGPFRIKMYSKNNSYNIYNEEIENNNIDVTDKDPLYDMLDVSYSNSLQHMEPNLP